MIIAAPVVIARTSSRWSAEPVGNDGASESSLRQLKYLWHALLAFGADAETDNDGCCGAGDVVASS